MNPMVAMRSNFVPTKSGIFPEVETGILACLELLQRRVRQAGMPVATRLAADTVAPKNAVDPHPSLRANPLPQGEGEQ